MTFGWYFRTDWESVLDNFSEYCHEKITDCTNRKYSYISFVNTGTWALLLPQSPIITLSYFTFHNNVAFITNLRTQSPSWIQDLTSCHCRHSLVGSRRRQSWWGSANITQSSGRGQHGLSSSVQTPGSPGHSGVTKSWSRGSAWLCLCGIGCVSTSSPGSARLQLVQTDNKSEIVELRIEERLWDCVCSVTVHSGVN